MGLNCLIYILRLTSLFPAYTESVYDILFSGSLPTGLIMYGFVMPGIEELLFRWILFDKFSRVIPVRSAAVISSIVFGIYHRNTIQLIYSFVFGLILAYCFYIFNSILASWLLHGSANITIYLISSLEIFSFMGRPVFQAVGAAAGLALTAVLLRKLGRLRRETGVTGEV